MLLDVWVRVARPTIGYNLQNQTDVDLMAAQSKKSAKKPSSKPKTPGRKQGSKKTPSKKQVKRKTNSASGFKRGFFIFAGLLFIVSIIAFAYFLGVKKTSGAESVGKATPKQTQKVVVRKVSKSGKKEEHKNKDHKKEDHKKVSHKQESESEKPKPVSPLRAGGRKPRLAIIIDDVHTQAQINAITALKMHITPSIFPPYRLSPDSHLLTRGLEHYMIHLPMESGNKKLNTQYKTLKVSFSNKKIENRIKELRLLFPKAKYINNHTGSVFTSDYAAMHLAYKIMRENGFVFLDSKTVNTSKVREIAHAYGDSYVYRDIFIDNLHTIPAIHAQLKKAVAIAKRKGYAIAIGHPHTVTMQALASAKGLLQEVELVYIDALYH